ncbi:hypothetical protein ACWF9G_23125 [Nocardia sp. NPDC055029]
MVEPDELAESGPAGVESIEAREDPRARPILGVELYEVPEPPQHPVQMLSWTRSSRARIPLMWYFALPYTLINVAGFMRSNRSWVRKPQAVLVWMWGAFSIIGTFLWATLAAETAIPYFVDADSQRMAGSIAAAVIAALILAPMWWRKMIRRKNEGLTGATEENDDSNAAAVIAALILAPMWWRKVIRRKNEGLTRATEENDDSNPAPELDRTLLANVVLHSLALLAVAATVIVIAPATNLDSQCVLHAASPPDCVIYRHDWVTIFALATAALSAVIVLICTVANLVCDDRTWSDTDADPLMAMSGLLALSLMVVNLGWSAAVMAVTWAMSYLGRHVPWIDSPRNVTEAAGLLRPANDFIYGPEIVVGIATPFILVGLLGVLILVVVRVIRRVRQGPSATSGGAPGKGLTRFKKAQHAVICDESRVRLTLFVIGLLAVTYLVPLWFLGRFPGWEGAVERSGSGQVEGPVVWTARLSEVSVDALLVSVTIALLIPSVRRPFAVLGDIAGYWNVKWHPLAALPYRGDVVRVLEYEISRADEPYVLVGHSQGSVLAFTAVKCAKVPAGKTRLDIYLVTCGSPLLSLYSRFFPFYFSTTAREEVEQKVIEWGNFWRDSDPIGCPLFGSRRNEFASAPNTFDRPDPRFVSGQTSPVASEAANADPDLTPADVDDLTLGHSDYWLVPAQQAYLKATHSPDSGQSRSVPAVLQADRRPHTRLGPA